MGDQWPYSNCFVRCCFLDLGQPEDRGKGRTYMRGKFEAVGERDMKVREKRLGR